MAAIANTYQRYQAKGLREQLADIIYDISPEDTPFFSSAGRAEAEQTLVEWQTDVLASPDTTNARIEGDDVTAFTAIVPTARVGNFTQISDKRIILSDTMEVINKAGRESELAYQIPRRGVELKIDIEAMGLENLGGAAGSSTVARVAAGLGAWLKTNTSFGAGGVDPTYTSGVPPTPRTDGTQRPFTEVILKDVAQQLWISGGNIRNLFVGPFNKEAVSAFTGVVTRNFDMSNVDPAPTAAIAAIDVYVTDWGSLKIIPSRFQRERDGWFLDFEFLSYAFLMPFETVELAKTGHAEKRLLRAQWTLVVNNEAALGIAADLNSS